MKNSLQTCVRNIQDIFCLPPIPRRALEGLTRLKYAALHFMVGKAGQLVLPNAFVTHSDNFTLIECHLKNMHLKKQQILSETNLQKLQLN